MAITYENYEKHKQQGTLQGAIASIIGEVQEDGYCLPASPADFALHLLALGVSYYTNSPQDRSAFKAKYSEYKAESHTRALNPIELEVQGAPELFEAAEATIAMDNE